MDLLNNLELGFAVAFSPFNLLFCFIGCIIGTIIGVRPGIGPSGTMALLLPLSLAVPAEASLIMMAGIYYGSQYGGSTTAILLRMPGEASSSVTTIDGYEMARQGRGGAALAVAALGSLFGGTVATIFVAALSPILSKVALSFGATEYVSLMVLGLIGSVILAHGSVFKSIAMILLGLSLGLVGIDANSGLPRFTFGIINLTEGIPIVPLAIGLFGISEIIRNLDTRQVEQIEMAKVTRLWPTREDFRRAWPAVLRGTGVGSLLGVLPGGGALLSSFASYALEKKVSGHVEEFGRGAVEGVAGPETANNAAAQTSFIPLLTLGLPTNVVMALMVGAFMIQGIQPGPLILQKQPNLVWGLIASMWIGNLMLVIINLPLIGIWVKLLRVPYDILFPVILVCCAVGAYSLGNNAFDVSMVAVFGILGYVLAKLECEPAPLILGFILGPIIEQNLRRALLISYGDPMVFVQRPMSLVMLIAAVILLILLILPSFRRTREVAFTEEE
jgi:TctA family transporter